MNAFKYKDLNYSMIVHSKKLLSPWPLLKYEIGRETYIIFKHIRNAEIWDSLSC